MLVTQQCKTRWMEINSIFHDSDQSKGSDYYTDCSNHEFHHPDWVYGLIGKDGGQPHFVYFGPFGKNGITGNWRFEAFKSITKGVSYSSLYLWPGKHLGDGFVSLLDIIECLSSLQYFFSCPFGHLVYSSCSRVENLQKFDMSLFNPYISKVFVRDMVLRFLIVVHSLLRDKYSRQPSLLFPTFISP